MRLDEFESSQPEVGDILEIEIGNELVETVIVGINRGNYIVESTSTDLLESKLNEVNPHNYDSDLDYYDAVNRSGRRRSSDDYEPADSGPTDDDIYYAKQRAQQQALAKTAPVQKQSNDDGQAPNGERYNTVVTFTSPDNNRNKMSADSYKDYHWGAKKVVDSKQDNGVYTLYVVDNHKHGMWKPWKDQPAEGYTVTRGIDKERYQARDGLEGPFSTKSGKVVYYDKVEGKYYDPDTDMYIEYNDWQAMNESDGEYDDEAGMAQSNLRTMARAVDGLIDTIKDNDNLPEWAQEKLAKAEMMTTGVWDYLLSQKEQGVDPKVEGVAEGSEQVYRVLAVDKSNALSKQVKLKVKASSLDEVFERLAINDWYPLEINGVEVINGKRLKQGVAEEKQRLDAKCWDGYKKQGTKMKGDTRVNNCVPESAEQDVTEVSTELRNRYVSRASSDYGSANFAARASKGHPGLEDYSKEQEARAKKRAAGLNRALSDKRRGVSESVNERAEKKEKVKVYVKNPKTGRVVKVDFGEPGQLIKKSKKHRKHGKKRWNLKK